MQYASYIDNLYLVIISWCSV